MSYSSLSHYIYLDAISIITLLSLSSYFEYPIIFYSIAIIITMPFFIIAPIYSDINISYS
jgi:hypothetical protein